ncbi:cupin domain protein [bacterium BMS3Abin04]|nr:cupin domain protein [bacterium BMS3Abin04]
MNHKNGNSINRQLSIQKLINEIEYQSSSIVSKQILKKENGNITLFAFGENEELTKHTSPYEAFVQIIEGEMQIEIGKEIFNLKSGNVILMPANIPHGLKALTNVKMLLTMIK